MVHATKSIGETPMEATETVALPITRMNFAKGKRSRRLYENTAMTGLDKGAPNRVRTAQGLIVAREVVLATNCELASLKEAKPHVTVFSSYAVMSKAAPEALAAMKEYMRVAPAMAPRGAADYGASLLSSVLSSAKR